MNICNIVPVKYNYLVFEDPMAMLLCHLSKENLKYSKDFCNYKGYKIMDNSIIELGESFKLDNLIKEAFKCRVDEIILPDVFQEGEKTLKKVIESINYLKKNNILKKFKLQAVCHGKNLEEFKNSFEELNKIKEIDVIGIPKILNSIFGNRCKLYNVFRNTNKEIHLLGCWESFEELNILPKEAFSKIRSLDTCLISLFSQENENLFNSKRPSKTIDFYNTQINVNNFLKLKNQLKLFIEKKQNNL